MTVDIFVHPEVPEEFMDPVDQEVYQNYLDSVIEKASCSDYPILVNGVERHDQYSVRGDFSSRAPEMPSINSVSYIDEDGNPITSGMVDPDSWGDLERLMEGKNDHEIRIHGSYFKKCPQSFAIQLMPYLEDGQHLYNWRRAKDVKRETVEKAERKVTKYAFDGKYGESDMWYGIVLADPKEKEEGNISLMNTSDIIAIQLIDDGSNIIDPSKKDSYNLEKEIDSEERSV